MDVLVQLSATDAEDGALLSTSLPWSTCWVVDVSMSMYGDIARVKTNMITALARVPFGSTLCIHTFAADVRMLVNVVVDTDATREMVRHKIQSIACRGGTNLEAAFRVLNEFPVSEHRINFGVALTDGQPMKGERDPTKLSELLSTERAFHLISYKSGADCWVAKAFAKRNVQNIVTFATTAAEVGESLDRIFPDVSKFVVSGVRYDCNLTPGVQFCEPPPSRALSDVVAGEIHTILLRLRVDCVDSVGPQTLLSLRISYFDDEFTIERTVILERTADVVLAPVPREIRAHLVKKTNMERMGDVQALIQNDDMRAALGLLQVASEESGAIVAEYRSVGLNNATSEGLVELQGRIEVLSQNVSAQVHAIDSMTRCDPSLATHEEFNDAEHQAVYRSIGLEGRSALLHNLVVLENDMSQAH